MHSSRKQQSGAILIVSMLLLLVLTVLGVVMMQTTRMQERMAGNTRDLSMALQGAEAGLRIGENVIGQAVTQPAATSTVGSAVFSQGALPLEIGQPGQFSWDTTHAKAATAMSPTVSGLASTPLYTVEELAFEPDSLLAGETQGRQFYCVSSFSNGATGKPYTVIQSTYARRF
jgi:type IV pilus assembly protein PilX